METQEQMLDILRKRIEAIAGREMRTPKDFVLLSASIFDKLHQNISATTLKRLWGYLSEVVTPRVSTLNILAQYVGSRDWDDFCRSAEPSISAFEETATTPERLVISGAPQKARGRQLLVTFTIVLALAVLATGWWLYFQRTEATKHYYLRQGQTFATYSDYLRLFGIHDSTTYWGKPLPHHPFIVLWGPEYHHPAWHNEGNKDSMMPTITERWEPPHTDTAWVVMRNRDKYDHEVRFNEVRITFMKNLTDSGYVFLGLSRRAQKLTLFPEKD